MSVPDWSLILNEVAALAIVLAPLEFLILRNVAVFRTFITRLLSSWTTKEGRQQLFTEIGHGMLRALKERSGSEAGVAARAAKSGILDMVTSGGAPQLLSQLGGKIDVPGVGKVTIGEAIEIAKAVKQLISGGGAGIVAQQSSSAGMPP